MYYSSRLRGHFSQEMLGRFSIREQMKMKALDLFSGYGGITLAMENYARPIMYCEIEKYAQAILLSRMDDGTIPFAPIWNDVTTLDGTKLRGLVDIVWGGFPCQDISSAGKGAGLEGKRSGLFYEVIRICKEASPEFIFLENVAAIRTRGSIEIQETLASIGYDCRFGMLSASEIGAHHQRDRWFCLAKKITIPDPLCSRLERQRSTVNLQPKLSGINSGSFETDVANPFSKRQQGQGELINPSYPQESNCRETNNAIHVRIPSEWPPEPSVGRVVDGCPNRSHRLKALGNGVVPNQVKIAFEILMGI